ncbi:filamentous hemagglutinin N-terminal domain-containing protein [Selenomonas sp.]|uniref:filamentous hemagglutinin N-terminal domain-containing protein n=1 Tax=Selenomonas sp. TaxID=2053611 RepID=UPI0025D8982E|nr:filamentous hemagglutinin N-terminal domain-containing protein [Selenomonas sp.]MCI6284304.1 filamentous hemagglutinin N-terminal domain-containing protein [Selenomonas sp.]
MAYERKEQLARSITLALTTGLFSIVPVVAEGAPVVDQVVTSGTSVEQSGKVTDVTSTVQNNIVNWKDFSVAKDETVRFDQGAKTNNYLNVVTGAKQSEIAGTVEGGKNVYLVNPHGVLVDKGATVNVGNLYVSTTTDTLDTKDYLTTGASPLVNTASTAAADVTNMGTIQASNVIVQGKNITFTNRYDVQADSVVFQATGEAALGARVSQQAAAASPAGLRRAPSANGSSSGTTYSSTNGDITLFSTIQDVSDLTSIKDMAGDYRLTSDIDLQNQTYTPIGNSKDNPFTGTFDGQYHTISNIYIVDENETAKPYGGLFGHTNHATISNVGVKGGTIQAACAGGIVGFAENGTTLTNVFNDGVTVKATEDTNTPGTVLFQAGGIVGKSDHSTINTAYNTGTFSERAGAIIGYANHDTVLNVYNTGSGGLDNSGVLFGTGDNENGTTITNAYTTGSAVFSTYGAGITATSVYTLDGETADSKKNQKKLSHYTFNQYQYDEHKSAWVKTTDANGNAVTDISNVGGGDTTWRIYEGQSLPLLRAFLKAKGTVTVNYDYTMGDDVSDSNNGADLSVKYNNNYVTFTNKTYTGADDIDTSLITEPGDTDYRNVINNTADTRAAFYTGQDGYDLVGNNITILKRKVTINADKIPSGTLDKTYDGTTKVDQAKLLALVTGGTTTEGLIAGDTTYETDDSSLSGEYYEHVDSGTPTQKVKNAGTGYDVVLSGGYSVKNKDNFYNYDIDTTNGTYDGKVLSGQGQINKASLTITQKSGKTITRTYNGKTNSAVADDDRLTAANGETKGAELFDLDGKVKVTTTTKNADGTESSTTTEDNVYVTTDATGGTGDYGTLKDGTFTKTGVAGDHDVAYEGITLGGTDAGNYTLVDADGNALTNNTFYGTGTIEQKEITSASLTFDGESTVSREYDGTQFYDDVASGTLSSTDVYSDDAVTFTMKENTTDGDAHKGHSAWFTSGGTDVVDQGKNYDVTYNVSIGGSDAGNYKIVNGTDTIELSSTEAKDATLTKTGGGSITPRILNMGLGTTKTDIDKDYDGDAYVKVTHDGTKTSEIAIEDNLVDYASGTTPAHKLLGTDGVTLKIEGTYPSENVVDANNDGIGDDQDITYTISLSGNDKGNYAFGTSAAATQTVTGATGAINPKELTIKIDDVSKTFDGTANAGTTTTDTLTRDNITLTGLVDETNDKAKVLTDTVIAALNKDSLYGAGTTKDTFKENEHVIRDTSTGKVIENGKDVQYTGLSSGSTNYKFASDTVYGKGTINPLEITDLTMAVKKPVTKTYDATTAVATSASDTQNAANPHDASEYIGAVTTTVNGKTLTLDAKTISLANGSDDAYFITDSASGTKSADVDTAKKARFLLTIDESGQNGYSDYTIASSLKDSSGKVAQDVDASITARTVYATQNATPVEKTYDAKTDIGRTGDDAVTITGLLSTLDKSTNTSTGKFADKNVAYDTDGNVTTKDIAYTITLNDGDATMQGNYKVVQQGDTTNTALAYGTSGALKGTGKITPHDLTVNIGTVKKTFDNTTAVPATGASFSVTLNDSDIQSDENNTKDDPTVTASASDALFVDSAADAGDAAKAGTKKNIQYQITLSGNDLKNYTVKTSVKDTDGNNTLSHTPGTYTFTTNGVTDTNADGNTIALFDLKDDDIVAAFDNITKVYDTTKNVTRDHTDKTIWGTQAESDKVDASDYLQKLTIGGIELTKGTDYSVKSAEYNTENVSATTAKYEITLLNDIEDSFNWDGVTKTFDWNGTTTKHYDAGTLNETTSASITPKQVTATLTETPTDATIEKYYDGKTTVQGVTNTSGGTIDVTKKIAVAGILAEDTGVQLDTDKINAHFEDANVAYDTAGNVTTKTVCYTAALKDTSGNNHAGNYVINVDTNGKENTTLTGTGKIDPRQLTLQVKDDSLTRRYNGGTALDASTINSTNVYVNAAGGVQNGETVSLDTSKITGDYGTNASTSAAAFEADKNVNWDGTKANAKAIHLTGLKDALTDSNYTIDNDAYYTVDDNKGRILRLALTADQIDTAFDGNIAKDYDNTKAVEDADSHLSIFVKSGVVGTETVPIAYDLDDTGTQYASADASTSPINVTYKIAKIQDSALQNFEIGDDLLNAYKGKELSTTGIINPRKLYASITTPLGDGGLQKTYDGNNTISGTGKTQSELDHNITVTNLLPTANDDGATVDIVTTFDDANVAYKTDDTTGKKAITTKDVHYTLSIGGTGKASNYVFYDKEGDDGKSLLDATTNTYRLTDADAGKITPATLTVDETKTGVATKTFDNNANVKTLPTFAFTGFVNNTDEAALGFDSSKVTGAYGTLADGVFTADKNVNRTANATTGEAGKDEQGNAYYYKGVQYTGFQDTLDALRDGTDTTAGNVIAGNYTIANTKYFEEALEKGVIKPLAITQSAIREIWANDITKPYDTTVTVNNATNQLAYKVLLGADGTTKDANVTKGDGDELVTIAYTLSTPATYNDANVKTANQVTYDIQAIDPAELQNYAMGAEAKAVIVKTHTLKNGDTTSDGIQHTVGITPKVLKYELGDDGSENVLSRTYNGKTKGVENTLKITDGIFGQDTGVTLTFDEETEAGNYGKYGKYNSPDIDATKITYKVKLAGNDAGNYTLDATKTHAGDVGSATEYDTLDAAAEITQRTVYVGFADGKGTGIDKEYGSSPSGKTVTAANQDEILKEVAASHVNDVEVKTTGKENADLLSDDDVKLDRDNIQMAYQYGTVQRNSAGDPDVQDVYFTNIKLEDTSGKDKAKNYKVELVGTTEQLATKDTLTGTGTITPKQLALTYDNASAIEKTYDGTSSINQKKDDGTVDTANTDGIKNSLEQQAASLTLPNDTLNFTVTGNFTGDASGTTATKTADGTATSHSNVTEGVAAKELGVKTTVTWNNDNYDVVFTGTDALARLTPSASTFADGKGTQTVQTKQGTITPKTLTVSQGKGKTEKTYTGYADASAIFTGLDNEASENSAILFTGLVDGDKNANKLATGAGTYLDADGHATPNASDDEKEDSTDRTVDWTKIELTNLDYQFADGTTTTTATGAGVIKRAPLTVVTDSVEGRFGQTPTLTGHVDDSSWKTDGDRADYNTRLAADPNLFVYNTAPGTSTRGGQSQSIYGWYHDSYAAPSVDTTTTGGVTPSAAGWYKDTRAGYATDGTNVYRNFGNYGRNYTIVQQSGTYTSQADGPNTDILNPARRVRPDMEVYNHVTHDDVGTVIRDPKAGIEYEAGGTSLQTDGSASYNGTMTVEGAGEVVNLTQSGTAASADRVDLTNGSANYTLSGAENVPTADVAVADVTDDVTSATTAASTMRATNTTGADDTTVTDDDDDDAVKAAAESSDDREAEATVEYAGQAPSLFSEAITGTKVAS